MGATMALPSGMKALPGVAGHLVGAAPDQADIQHQVNGQVNRQPPASTYRGTARGWAYR
jgi:hypothetical protein